MPMMTSTFPYDQTHSPLLHGQGHNKTKSAARKERPRSETSLWVDHQSPTDPQRVHTARDRDDQYLLGELAAAWSQSQRSPSGKEKKKKSKSKSLSERLARMGRAMKAASPHNKSRKYKLLAGVGRTDSGVTVASQSAPTSPVGMSSNGRSPFEHTPPHTSLRRQAEIHAKVTQIRSLITELMVLTDPSRTD